MRLNAAEIHARVDWPLILEQLGIGDSFLRIRKAGPCPACGGRDRYTFDNRHGRGDFICRHCGAGDGFELLERVHGWSFSEARKRVIEAAGLAIASGQAAAAAHSPARSTGEPARPTHRVLEILRTACEPTEVEETRQYLAARALWPLPADVSLRAHASLEYFEERERIGRFAGLVALVSDVEGELVTAHLTYLEHGRKLELHEPRKLLSRLTGRKGCAVRLVQPDDGVLGIAEGIETALSAYRLFAVPTWAALNAALLSRFEPPPGLRKLVVFADRDVAGLEAAAQLLERLQGSLPVEIRTPPAPLKDFNDLLTRRASGPEPQT
ncbi:MAG TPA: toprim domain-containing protein [Steroidobacteraceae bacterium]|nr:toprim domain-containing protein [Steroidobacteraceae bacterium]